MKRIDWTQEKKDKVVEAIENWMRHPKHSASWIGGEGIMQNDDCIIDSADLISDLVDDIIKPIYIYDEDED